MDEVEQLKEQITKLESENATYKTDIEKLNSTVTEKDTKIAELQSYICKNLTSPKSETDHDEITDFVSLYRETISELKKV